METVFEFVKNYSTTFITIGLSIVVTIVTFLISTYYKNKIVLRPRLFVSTTNPLFSQRNHNYQYYEWGWELTIKIKNNSSNTAYHVELIFPKGQNIDENKKAQYVLKKNNDLPPNAEFIIEEVRSSVKRKIDEVLNFTIEDGVRVFTHGMKILNPKESLKPNKVDNIKLYIKYKNEQGKTFYTRFTKVNNIEKNKLFIIKPFLCL